MGFYDDDKPVSKPAAKTEEKMLTYGALWAHFSEKFVEVPFFSFFKQTLTSIKGELVFLSKTIPLIFCPIEVRVKSKNNRENNFMVIYLNYCQLYVKQIYIK